MYKQQTSDQRYTISVLLQRKCTKNEIAKAIGMSNSTITRELKRNSSTRGVYKWDKAQRRAEKHKHQVPGNRSVKSLVRDMDIDLLKRYQWSSEQISGYLARKGYKISHETIYAIIRKDKYANRGSLYKHSRHRLKHPRRHVGKIVIIPDRVSIHQRPAEADRKHFVASLSNFSTSSNSLQSLTSCQGDISSSAISLSGVSFAAFTTSCVFGTFSLRNSST